MRTHLRASTVAVQMKPNVYSQNNYVDSGSDGMYAEGMLALILHLCRCAGIAPLSATRARAGWLFRVSTTLAALHTVVCTVINIMSLASIILELYQDPDERVHAGDTVMQACVWISNSVLMLVIASLAIYRGQAQMDTLKRVLDQLEKIYFDLSVPAPSAKTVRMKNFAMVVMLLWMTSIMLMDFIMYYMQTTSKGDGMWTINLCYGLRYISDLQGMLAVVQWACTVLAVHKGATALNHNLMRLRDGSESSTLSGDVNAKKPDALIQRLALSYERMSDIMRQMNDTNGPFLMAILISTFLRLVITPYYMLYLQRVHGIILSINWMFIHLAVLLLTVEPCHWTHTQRENTAILLSDLMVHRAPKCERLSKELDQFAKQMTLDNTTFSALGVYTLDRQLSAAILGGVTTYTVLIIQFDSIANV